MAEDLIRYDILVQEALRGVMRKVLTEVSRTGLPGNHHFFITFLTTAPGVRISSRLRERYPEQMTIVVQYQFWDLKVSETGFEIGLSFSDIPERLEVPFSAVRGIYDPSVNFELEFDVRPEAEAEGNVQEISAAKGAKPADADKETKALPGESEDTKDKQDGKEKVAAEGDAKSAEVVSLDSFRKK